MTRSERKQFMRVAGGALNAAIKMTDVELRELPQGHQFVQGLGTVHVYITNLQRGPNAVPVLPPKDGQDHEDHGRTTHTDAL